MEDEEPPDIGDIEIVDAIHARAGLLALDVRMTDQRKAQLLTPLPEVEFVMNLKFLRMQNEGDWIVEV